jgi:H+/gluconate symporter-like permease
VPSLKILEVSGAAEQIAATLIKSFGLKIFNGLFYTGFLIGIPLYYNAGLSCTIAFTLARKPGYHFIHCYTDGSGMSTTHCRLIQARLFVTFMPTWVKF